MTDRELKHLSRTELLRLLIQQMKKNEVLEARLQDAENRLRSRELDFAQCGSMAEAALRLNQIFAAADQAAADYLANVKRMNPEKGGRNE